VKETLSTFWLFTSSEPTESPGPATALIERTDNATNSLLFPLDRKPEGFCKGSGVLQLPS
jgi:hypothetical protein